MLKSPHQRYSDHRQTFKEEDFCRTKKHFYSLWWVYYQSGHGLQGYQVKAGQNRKLSIYDLHSDCPTESFSWRQTSRTKVMVSLLGSCCLSTGVTAHHKHSVTSKLAWSPVLLKPLMNTRVCVLGGYKSALWHFCMGEYVYFTSSLSTGTTTVTTLINCLSLGLSLIRLRICCLLFARVLQDIFLACFSTVDQ